MRLFRIILGSILVWFVLSLEINVHLQEYEISSFICEVDPVKRTVLAFSTLLS